MPYLHCHRQNSAYRFQYQYYSVSRYVRAIFRAVRCCHSRIRRFHVTSTLDYGIQSNDFDYLHFVGLHALVWNPFSYFMKSSMNTLSSLGRFLPGHALTMNCDDKVDVRTHLSSERIQLCEKPNECKQSVCSWILIVVISMKAVFVAAGPRGSAVRCGSKCRDELLVG